MLTPNSIESSYIYSSVYKDPDLFGEMLRKWSFTGNGLGCYSDFDIRDEFIELDNQHSKHKLIIDKLGMNNKYYENENITPHVYYNYGHDLFMAFYWDGDGTLLFGYRNKWVRNDDCKKTYGWEWVD